MGKGLRAALWRHSCAPSAGAGPAERAVRAVELLASLFASPRLLSLVLLSPASKRSAALSLCGRRSAAGGAAMAAGSALRAGAGLRAACWGEWSLRPSFCCCLGLLAVLFCSALPTSSRSAASGPVPCGGRVRVVVGRWAAPGAVPLSAPAALRDPSYRLALLILTFFFFSF